MKRKTLALATTFLFLMAMIAPTAAFGSVGTSTEGSTETVISPTPVPGAGFDVPVVVPGANLVVTFTLADDGSVASASVTGAPEGANIITTGEGVKITYLDGQTPVVVEVEADIEVENGVIVSVEVKTEYDADAADEGTDSSIDANNENPEVNESVEPADNQDQDIDNADAADSDDAAVDNGDTDSNSANPAPLSQDSNGSGGQSQDVQASD